MEGLFFLGGGALCFTAQNLLHERRLRLFGILHIIAHGIYITAAVGKGRKEKPCFGDGNHPITNTRRDDVFILMIA